MTACFELYQDSAEQYRFRLRASNGHILLVSQAYTRQGGAINGIASVKTNAPLAVCYQRQQTVHDQSIFHLRAAYHQVVGTSEYYASAAARERGVECVKRCAPNAPIELVL